MAVELDWEKPWRDQVFGATKQTTSFLELDWEKPWRDQVFGAKMSETNQQTWDSEAAFGSESATRGGSFWTRIRLGKAVA